jgi:hypothetical protein
MFKVKKELVIAQNEDNYISFPDIVQSEVNPDTYFLTYRVGDNHHPTFSNLVIQRSKDKGETWEMIKIFSITLESDNMVWNCPRLSYVDKKLHVICDAKNGTVERIAQFKTYFLTSEDEGENWSVFETPFIGMVPDKIIKFKGKLFCANHKIKSELNDLIQLISWSEGDNLWYNTNTMAHSLSKQFCEASVVNMGDYLIGYLRDNGGHNKNVYTVRSKDGMNWGSPEKLPIFGQRVTALRDGDNIIGAYRDTEAKMNLPFISGKRHVSIFEHNIESNEVEVSHIDWEYPQNQYHFGYTGLAKLDNDSYLLAYYIKQKEDNPFIKLSFIERS